MFGIRLRNVLAALPPLTSSSPPLSQLTAFLSLRKRVRTDAPHTTMADEGPRPGQQVIEVVLPTYKLKPDETEKFYPSQAKKICGEVTLRELNDWKYDDNTVQEKTCQMADLIKSEVAARAFFEGTTTKTANLSNGRDGKHRDGGRRDGNRSTSTRVSRFVV